jgi:Fe-S cluster assembly scaffold protein SufB
MEELKKNLEKNKNELLNVGFDLNNKYPRSGSFLMIDNKESVVKTNDDSLIVLPISKAIKKYSIIDELYFNLVKKDKDEYTLKSSKIKEPKGFFILAKENSKHLNPVQTCFFLKATHYLQNVHNILVAEKNSELHIINGCISDANTKESEHIGITEIYVKEGATVSYTMIHDWGKDVSVHPRTCVKVEKGGKFISNYIAVSDVKYIDSNPKVILGENAYCGIYSSVFARKKSFFDLGATVILNGKKSKAEILSRVVSNGGKIISKAEIDAKEKDVFGHTECDGLSLNSDGEIKTIPILSTNQKDVSLSHEAAIGKIASEEIEYLMTRGLTDKEAKALIIKGFLDLKIKGLPEKINEDVTTVINNAFKNEEIM